MSISLSIFLVEINLKGVCAIRSLVGLLCQTAMCIIVLHNTLVVSNQYTLDADLCTLYINWSWELKQSLKNWLTRESSASKMFLIACIWPFQIRFNECGESKD